MGRNGVFVMLLVAVLTLALQPSLVNYSFAGTIVLPELTCDDGLDNDGDGLIDLDDPDCHAIILKPVPGALPELPGFPGDPEDPLLGDFKCYEAIAPHLPEIVLLLDQFQKDKQYRILDVERVCNNIVKLPEEDFPGSFVPDIENQHYKVYNIIDEEFEDDVLLQDQWGTTRHTHLTPTELWVPQDKIHRDACPPPFTFDPDIGTCVNTVTVPDQSTCDALGGTFIPPNQCLIRGPPPIPDAVFPARTDIHWKCYDVPPKTPDEFFDVRTIDRNFIEGGIISSTVIQLDKICTPVKKSVCMEGYEFTPEGLCQDAIGVPTDDFTPIMFGDSTIPDHLTCYDIRGPILEPGNNFGVTYAGQFQEDIFDIMVETEICLFASKIHVPDTPDNGPGGPQVGGTFIPIDSTSLLLVVAQTTASWMIPVIVSAVGIGIVVARKISSKKE